MTLQCQDSTPLAQACQLPCRVSLLPCGNTRENPQDVPHVKLENGDDAPTPMAASAIGVSYPGAAWALNKLVEAGMVRELGPFKRGRMFFAEELVRKIEEDV